MRNLLNIHWLKLILKFSIGGVLFFFFQNCNGGFQVVGLEESSVGLGSLAPPSLEQQKAMEVLTNNCNSCHGTANLGGVTNITDPKHLVSSGLVVPGEPSKSKILQSVVNNRMPPNNPLSTSDQTILSEWIALLGNKSPGGSVIPADLSFTMPVTSEPHLFRHRLSKLITLLGSANDASLATLKDNRFLLGDYDFAKAITPKYSMEVTDMRNWLTSLQPICKSTQLSSRFAWPAGASAFVQTALARDLNAADNQAIQQIQAQTATTAEKFEIFCLVTLSSLEFLSK